MTVEFHTADVFTDRPFGGNQLAVLPDASGLTTEQMTNITREFNFSESVFVLPPENPANACRLRIFTPGAELPFAGHPTVGAAFVLASIGVIDASADETRVIFEEGIGLVPVLIHSSNGRPVFTQLTAAKLPEHGSATYDASTIASVLSLEADDLDVSAAYQIESWSAGVPFLFVPVTSRDALVRARIHTERWERALRDSW
ncbi:MAG: PhzF family phenazine biosynthesis protein, partial [Gemmatimonadaceae bacterium]